MKKLIAAIITLIVFLSAGTLSSQTFTCSINGNPMTVSMNYTLTCSTPSITLQVTASTTNAINCTWTSSSGSVSGNPQSFSSAAVYTLSVKDVVTNVTESSTISITQNTTTPTSSVFPTSQVITCGSSTNFTASATSPVVNIEHSWYTPVSPYPFGPAATIGYSTMDIHSVISGPGVYTHILKDLVNGCVTVKTITVSTISGFPSFNTSSTTNYMLGCSPLNQSTLCAINAITSSSVSPQFALLPPGSPSTIPLPSSAFNLNNCNTISTPGAYTLVVYDQANACQTAQQVNIFQNTAPPHLAVSMISQTLTCFNPTILATGSSTTSGAVLSWMVPSTPPVVPSPTVIVGPTTGPAPSTVATSYATYTAIATNTLNACVAQTTVLISQNFKIPTPFMAVGNPSVIGCNNVPVLLSYTNNAANSGIPGAVAIVISWMGPAPQASLAASSYSAYVAGVYTLTVQDNKNGCIGSITKVVPQNTSIVTGPAVYTMACTGTVEISPLIISGGSYSYTWTSTAGSGSFLTSVNSKSVTVNGGGTYYCSIYN
ncbi:MAG: hypothetical protein K0S12_658, partial [Bacteroidetes bacterium]|nr:hypothetical protein [Bacteroidota bacterium]